jgi:hypothetical protein
MNAIKILALALGLTLTAGALVTTDANARPRRAQDGWGEVYRPMPVRQFLAPVRIINDKHQWVSVFVDGRFLTTIAPGARARVELPLGVQTLTYKVGHRNVFRTATVTVRPHGINRVIIPNHRGYRYDFERVGWW